MLMLVNCSNCHTPLQLPPGATSNRCAICQAITQISGQSRPIPPAPQQSYLQNTPSFNGYHKYYPLQPPPPSPYYHAPPGLPPPVHGTKKAVIIGIAYKNTKSELKGCMNDTKCIMFPESSIIMLTEEETDPTRIPTKHNIRMAMFWLVQGCQPGNSLVFHYSGHGGQQRNYTGDELDGYDETLCP